MADDLNGKIGLDVTDFKAGIAEINRQIRVMESGFRASAASLGDWAKSADGLELRIRALNDELDLQKKKVEAIQGQYDKVAKEKGEFSRAAQELQIKLNKETETLGKMQTELKQSEEALQGMGSETKDAGEAMDKLGNETDDAGDKMEKLKKIMGTLKGAMDLSIKAIAGVGAAVVGAGAAISGLVLKASDAAGELVDLSLETGFTVTQLQEMAYVGGQVGTSQDVIAKSLAKLTRGMSEAGQGVETYKDLFDRLGVSATNADGSLRDSQTVFGEVIDALGGISNETERDAIALELFGRSAMELNPLIKAGADEISRLTDEAHEMGAVMDEEAVMGLEAFGDELDGLKRGLQGTMGTIAAAFLPGFQQITGAAKEYMQEFASIVSNADGDLGKMAEGIGGLLGDIINDIAAKGPELLNAGLGILQGIITAITSNLPALIPAVIEIVNSIVQFIVQNLPLLVQAGVDILMALVNGILPALPMLIDAGLKMIVTLANGIAEAIPTLLPMIAEIIPQIILTLIENLPLLIDAALLLIMALVDGLIVALPILIEYIPEIVQAIFDALIVALPLIGDAAVKIVLALIEGISKMMPKIGEAAGKLIVVLGQGIGNLRSKILEVGKNIVSGVWEGIKGRYTWFRDQVFNFFSGIVKGIKTALGIKSPSTVFAGIGENLALGLGSGFTDAISGVKNDINGMVGGLKNVDVNGSFSGQAAGMLQPAPVYVTVQANVAQGVDYYRLAHRIGEELSRRRR